MCVYLFEKGGPESGAGQTLPLRGSGCTPTAGPERALRPLLSAPRSPALLGVPTHPELSPEKQVGHDEAEQAAQRPLPAQELVRAAAQPQHGLPQQPGHRGGHPAGGLLLHLRPRAGRHRPFLLRFLALLLWGSPGRRPRPQRLLRDRRSRASLGGVLGRRRARHLQPRLRAETGTRAARLGVGAERAAGPRAGRAPRGAGGWVPCDVSPGGGGGGGGASRGKWVRPSSRRGGAPGA